MTTEEFNLLTDPWKGKLVKLALQLGKSKDQMKKYRNGTCKIPDDVALAVRKLGLPPEPQLPPPRMTVAEFRELSQKWNSRELSLLLNIPKGTIDSYKSSERHKTVSRLAENRLRILIRRDSAGECVADLFREKKISLRLTAGGKYVPERKKIYSKEHA